MIAGELLESPFPVIGVDGSEAAPVAVATVLGLNTSANGPPGAGATEEAGVSQLERWDLLPLSLF